MRPAVLLFLAGCLAAAARPAPGTEVFADSKDAVARLARQITQRLYTTPGLPDATILVRTDTDAPLSTHTSRLLSGELRLRGYTAISPDGNARASTVLRLSVESREQVVVARIDWLQPCHPPLRASWSRLPWLNERHLPPDRWRVDSGTDARTRETALEQAYLVARRTAADRVIQELEPGRQEGRAAASFLELQLSGHRVHHLVVGSFVQQTGSPLGPRYRAFLLCSLPDHEMRRLAQGAERAQRFRHRELLIRSGISIVSVLACLTLYAWADHRTRGFFRAPLRVAAVLAVTSTVLGVWIV